MHTSYVDGVLSDEHADAMQTHTRSCEACAASDARIRRALFLVRNIPRIEPSADFQERLFRRIGDEHARQSHGLPNGPSVRAFAVSAISLIFIGVLATKWQGPTAETPRLSAVVSYLPATLDSVTAPALMAAMLAGMAVWPALWLAEEAPFRYASDVAGPAANSPAQP
jgi:anti-sigma factor RsiW